MPPRSLWGLVRRYMFQFLQRFRHAVLMQCAPFRRRALCLLFTVVLFGQLAKTPSIHEVKHQLQRFHHWLCDELGGGEAKDLSEAFGDAETFQLFYFDGPRENFSAEEAQNSVGVLPTLSSCMAVFEEQIADGSFEWHDSTMEGRIRDPTWWKVSPVRSSSHSSHGSCTETRAFRFVQNSEMHGQTLTLTACHADAND